MCTCSRPVSRARIRAIQTASEVVFIPPAHEPGEPPTNISAISIINAGSGSAPTLTMFKPAVRPETDWHRSAVSEAAIAAVGRQGMHAVALSKIARSAGVSPALAHHYFGGKDQLFLATRRHLLADFGEGVREALRASDAPRARISSIIRQSFGPDQFVPATVAAWLAFYVLAQSNPEARPLLGVYARRLNSNLVDALTRHAPRAGSPRTPEGVAAPTAGKRCGCCRQSSSLECRL